MLVVHLLLPDDSHFEALFNLVVSAAAGALTYIALMSRFEAAELVSARALLKSLLSRGK